MRTPQDAELLIAVRTARCVGVSTDALTVYESRGGRAGAQLWRVQRKGALSGSPPLAFGELRADVERTPAPTKKQP